MELGNKGALKLGPLLQKQRTQDHRLGKAGNMGSLILGTIGP